MQYEISTLLYYYLQSYYPVLNPQHMQHEIGTLFFTRYYLELYPYCNTTFPVHVCCFIDIYGIHFAVVVLMGCFIDESTETKFATGDLCTNPEIAIFMPNT